MEINEKILSKLSVETIKQGLMKTAFGAKETCISRLDPRILMVWYLIFAISPWFLFDKAALLAMFGFVAVVAVLSRINGFIVFMLCFGIVSELVCYALVSYFIGGGMQAFLSLIVLTLKLIIVSLSSVAIFNSMDPERLSDAMLSFGMPGQIAFGISYGYRMMPAIIEQYNNLVNSFRLRSKPPEKNGFLYLRKIGYMIRMIVYAFYPLMFNMAKHTRTTAETLEVRGFSYALYSREVRRRKLSYLRIRPKDVLFLSGSVLYVILIFHYL